MTQFTIMGTFLNARWGETPASPDWALRPSDSELQNEYRSSAFRVSFVFLVSILVSAFALSGHGQDSKPVSYFNDMVPIFKRSCTGCHHPGKLKGDLDLTTYPALQKGGKHGAVFTAGDPKKSRL